MSEGKAIIVDPNTPEARAVSSAFLDTLEGVVPFHVLMGGIIRLFATVMLMAVELANVDDRETTRTSVLQLLTQMSGAVRDWPHTPANMRLTDEIPDGKVN